MARSRKRTSLPVKSAGKKTTGHSRRSTTREVASASGALFTNVLGRLDVADRSGGGETRAQAAATRAKRRGKATAKEPAIDRLPAFDSWYAKYSSVTTRLMLSAQPKMRAVLTPEKTLGRDDRLPVKNVNKFPYSAICLLTCVPRHGRYRYQGTGWLVGPRLLFTAGHNLHSLQDGGYMATVYVYPARNGSQFGHKVTAQANHLRTTTVWEQSNPNGSAFDIGAIVLPEPVDVNTFGYFGYQVFPAAEAKGRDVMVAGYPGGKSETMWYHQRTVIGTRRNQLVYDADTSEGQSGAPVMTQYNGEWISIGIHNYGDAAGNIATWINNDVIGLLEEWQAEAGD
jgi:V8-like Glu-specific endopeptidase